MENQRKNDKIPYIAATVAFLLFIGSLAFIINGKIDPKLYGKQVLFKAKYTTAQGIQQVAPGRLMFSDCIQEPTELKITEDTVIFITRTGSIGFKPLSVKDLTKIPCVRQDGTRVNIERIKTPPKSEYKPEEIILVVQPEVTIVLTKEEECVPLGKN